jgi:hypothetical protein
MAETSWKNLVSSQGACPRSEYFFSHVLKKIRRLLKPGDQSLAVKARQYRFVSSPPCAIARGTC